MGVYEKFSATGKRHLHNTREDIEGSFDVKMNQVSNSKGLKVCVDQGFGCTCEKY